MSPKILFHDQRKDLVRLAALVSIAVSVAVLIGWAANIETVKSLLPGYPTMKPNTALGLILVSTALFLRTLKASKVGKGVTIAFALTVIATATAELVQITTGTDLGVDRLIFAAFGDGEYAPGTMAPQSAVNFLAIGLGVICLNGGRRLARASEPLVLISLFITFASVLGHLYGADMLYGTTDVNRIAIHAAVVFAIVGFGCLVADRSSRLAKLFLSESTGGIAVRRLMPVVVFIPVAVGTFQVMGQDLGLYDAGWGTVLNILTSATVMFFAVYQFTAVTHRTDVRRRAIERQLVENEQRLRDIIDHSQGIISTHRVDGTITSANPAVFQSIGYRPEEVVGSNLGDFIQKDHRTEFEVYLRRVLNEGEASGLASMIAKNGRPVVWRYHNILIADAGKEPYVLGHATDVTTLVRTQMELQKLSLTDELTGLYNRRGFLTLADQQLKLERHRGTARGLKLLFADMDGLKAINDELGHEAGNEAIVEFARVLKSVSRSADLVARWGGDEFVLLMIGDNDQNSELMSERIAAALDEFNAKSGRPFRLACSVGRAPVELAAHSSFEECIAAADEAMYAEKRRKKAGRRSEFSSSGDDAAMPPPMSPEANSRAAV